jgi:muconate cycloisomerase
MKITTISTTPLFCKFKQPYYWAQGVTHGAPIILIRIETDAGVAGIGESSASPDCPTIMSILADAIPAFIGKSAFDGNRLIWSYYQEGFNARGTGSASRFFSQAMTGIELALWDAIGKAAKQPLHRLLGGKVREELRYFGFIQGDTADELSRHAKSLVKQGFEVLYLKIGRGDDLDEEITSAVRAAIGNKRLRLDANEAWDMLRARRMFERLKSYDPEFIEQPVPGKLGAEGLARLRAVTSIPVAADQTIYAPEDVYDICRNRSADVVVMGLHETCGVVRFRKAAAIAEAAGVNVCLHGIFETGITTCASNQVAATIDNMDNGNQIMWQLLAEDIVKSPSLVPKGGALPIFDKPGLGFELDEGAVARAADAYDRGKKT